MLMMDWFGVLLQQVFCVYFEEDSVLRSLEL
jgi:hypothetical protein